MKSNVVLVNLETLLEELEEIEWTLPEDYQKAREWIEGHKPRSVDFHYICG